MDTLTLKILVGMGVMLLVVFGVAWIAVRSARADRTARAARPYTHRHRPTE